MLKIMTISISMTFAHMVKANLRFLPNLKDLAWLFPSICPRKDQAAMTAVERQRYLCAFEMINNDGTLGELVEIHSGSFMQYECPPASLAPGIFAAL